MRVLKLVVAFALVSLMFACSSGNKGPDVPPEVLAQERILKAETESVGKALKDMGVEAQWEAAGRIEAHKAVIYAVKLDQDVAKESPYLTLDEAVESKLVEVREHGEGGDVNRLEVLNKSGKPVFLMAGDFLLGGQQDRIVAESLIVNPGKDPVLVPVFCVESGRWHIQSKDGELAATRTFSNTKEMGQVTNDIKAAALRTANQGSVWQEVATQNTYFGASAGNVSNTFRASLDSGETQKLVEAAFADAKKKFAGKAHGFAMVVDGEVVALDMFESAELAGKLMDKLVRSYLASAIGMERAVEMAKAGGDTTARAVVQTLGAQSEADAGRDAVADSNRTIAGLPQTQVRTAVGRNDADRTRNVQTASDGPVTAYGFGGGAGGGNGRESAQPTQRVTTPTASTSNKVDSDGSSVKLTSEDKSRGTVVHRSFLRR